MLFNPNVPDPDKVLVVDCFKCNNIQQTHITSTAGDKSRSPIFFFWAMPTTLNSPGNSLESINVEARRYTPTTFSNLYDTPHTSEKTAGITLYPPPCTHTPPEFPPHVMVFIRDSLLKAAQEFLMYFNFIATAVA